jgi:hypothetical protein
MRARAIAADSPAELRERITAVATADFVPTLAVAFAADTHDFAAVGRVFAEVGVDVFGASSAGEIIVGDGGESVRVGAIVASLFDLDRSAYCLRLLKTEDASSESLGDAAGAWARETFARPALLVVATTLTTDGEVIVRRLHAALGPDTPIFGGMAADNMRFVETNVFTGDEVSSRGVVLLALDSDRVAVEGLAVSGWTAVGLEKTVTSAEGNVVHTIDDAPALDVYKEYLGLTNLDVGTELGLSIAEYPLQVERGGYSVLRAAMMPLPETGSLLFAGTVPQGVPVRFSCIPGIEITEMALAEMRSLRERTPEADALVLFSCKARHNALGPMAEDEVNPIQKLWGAPMVGFYTYGEIGRTSLGLTDFHNETCVLVALKEK